MWMKLQKTLDTTASSCFDRENSPANTSGKKRQADEMSGDSDSSSPKTTKPIMPSTKIKREREKRRRTELSSELDNLSELVFRIDPVLVSGREECAGLKDAKRKQPSLTNNVTNRTELVKSSIRLIEKLDSASKEKDVAIAALTKHLVSLTQQQTAVQDATGNELLSARNLSPHPLLHTSSSCIPPTSFAGALGQYLSAASQSEPVAATEVDTNQTSFTPNNNFVTSQIAPNTLTPGYGGSRLHVNEELLSLLQQQQYVGTLNIGTGETSKDSSKYPSTKSTKK
mmetsp:Transcript_989/g.1434  ORF Transcript_989/g.1434 Transcript_989/m.1434 type:complete len:284 (-) Transcript_989:24-875(-)